MLSNVLRCTVIYRPQGGQDVLTGTVVKCPQPISLLGDIDFRSGVIRCGSTALKIVPNTVLCYPRSIGSTVGPYSLYALKLIYGEPRAIICVDPDILTVVGAVLFDIPLIKVSESAFNELDTGVKVTINLNEGTIVLQYA